MKLDSAEWNVIGKAAYDAYCQKREWKSVRGDQLPQWDQQAAELQVAWIAGVKAAIKTAMSMI